MLFHDLSQDCPKDCSSSVTHLQLFPCLRHAKRLPSILQVCFYLHFDSLVQYLQKQLG